MDRWQFNGVTIFGLHLLLSFFRPERRDSVTTAEVCERVVKPQTIHHPGSSFADVLGSGAWGVAGRALVRNTADVFVSHAWGDKFADVVDAIQVLFSQSSPFALGIA